MSGLKYTYRYDQVKPDQARPDQVKANSRPACSILHLAKIKSDGWSFLEGGGGLATCEDGEQ